jgi:hypothetical protein
LGRNGRDDRVVGYFFCQVLILGDVDIEMVGLEGLFYLFKANFPVLVDGVVHETLLLIYPVTCRCIRSRYSSSSFMLEKTCWDGSALMMSNTF